MNNVQLVGRLTKDPDIRTPSSGMAVARFTVAVDRIPDKNGEKKADFPTVIAFGKTAEIVSRFWRKGKPIGVTGRIQTGSYEDRDGKKVYTTDVIADRVEFVPTDKEQTAGAPARQERRTPEPAGDPMDDYGDGFAELDEEVPF